MHINGIDVFENLDWNNTAADRCGSKTVHQQVAEQAMATPSATAVMCGDQVLTYAELNDYSDCLASLIFSLIGAEDCVALYLNRGVEIAVGILGILKAGGVYVPIDPEYPSGRAQWMLQHSKTKVVITSRSLLPRLAECKIETICIDLETLHQKVVGEPFNVPVVQREQVASLIYTSGSTGLPKGVELAHGSLTNTLTHSCNAFGFTLGDVMAVIASFSFDISLLELATPWFSGACSLIFTREEILNIDLFIPRLEQVTVFLGIPSFLRHVLGQIQGFQPPRQFQNIRRILIGGELVPPDIISDARVKFPSAAISILYGPTETTLICAEVDVADKPVTKPLVGKPISNTAIYILDLYFQPVPAGVTGELYVAGHGVSRCYKNQSDLTATQFLPDPFANLPGSRMYKTGDLGRYTEDGKIEFAGRMDRQVKIRGHRIEPAEIDMALAAHAAVDACVTIDSHDGDEVKLVSYFIAKSGYDTKVETLLQWLRMRLPVYMVPSAIVKIDKIPLTLNGKLDRKALPPPCRRNSAVLDQAEPGSIEQRVLDIWKKLLQTELIGINDNFFDVGGHSLLLARLRSTLAEEFGRKLSIVEMFNFPTVSSMAKLVSGSSTATSGDTSIPQVAHSRLQQLQARRLSK
jgi:amino acid adenylation domain-containing protein